jgi:hypothetical protein
MSQQKVLAFTILEGVKACAFADPAIFKNGEYLVNASSVECSYERLLQWLNNDHFVSNPSYQGMDLLTEKLLILATHHVATYKALLAPTGFCADISSMNGLYSLHNLLSAIYDDHNYHLDEAGEQPVIRNDEVFEGRRLSYITPASLLKCVEALSLSER